MEFTNMLAKARELTGSANEVVIKLLDEFNAALPTMRALGFDVVDVQVTMGLLPEVRAKLVAVAANVDVKAVDEMIRKRSDQKALVAVLKGLQTAYNVRDQLGDLGLRGVEIEVTLGLPPKVSVGFIKNAAAASSALTAAAA